MTELDTQQDEQTDDISKKNLDNVWNYVLDPDGVANGVITRDDQGRIVFIRSHGVISVYDETGSEFYNQYPEFTIGDIVNSITFD